MYISHIKYSKFKHLLSVSSQFFRSYFNETVILLKSVSCLFSFVDGICIILGFILSHDGYCSLHQLLTSCIYLIHLYVEISNVSLHLFHTITYPAQSRRVEQQIGLASSQMYITSFHYHCRKALKPAYTRRPAYTRKPSSLRRLV